MKILIWQWGRFGGGPRVAVELATALRAQPGYEVVLSLARGAEIRATTPGDWPVKTYAGRVGFIWRVATLGPMLLGLIWRLRQIRPDFAICAMPGLLDLVMAAALRLCGIRFAVVMHDASPHPGDRFPLQFWLHILLTRQAEMVIVLSRHVGHQLPARQRIINLIHPPFAPRPLPPPGAHGGPYRVLFVGRLLSYKGLDLLADALEWQGPRPDMELRVVGYGAPSSVLDRLAALPGVTVENRWVPEAEFDDLLGWADAVILPYLEASQSGVAAAALSSGRRVLGTLVGGLTEQLAHDPAAELCAPTPVALANALRDLLDHRRFVPLPPRPDPQAAWRMAIARLVEALPRL
ncbi:MAG: glycosyltransferase family 4 protein [Acetobacteraceae bacterium]|nr:glycosyltransferase family 4 protein [Acetobacteraceae bacterium]